MKRYAIVEDEDLAAEQLHRIISGYRPEWELRFRANSLSAFSDMQSKYADVDLFFMDIELGDGNIFNFFEYSGIDIPVIFTTAYDNYGLDAIKANVVSYVLKPWLPEDIHAAIEKYERTRLKANEEGALMKEILEKIRETPVENERILISSGDNYRFEYIKDIAWFEAEEGYVVIVTSDGKKEFTMFSSLGEVEELTIGKDFFRVSRSTICSISSISKISKYFKGRLKIELRAGKTTKDEIITSARKLQFLSWIGRGTTF